MGQSHLSPEEQCELFRAARSELSRQGPGHGGLLGRQEDVRTPFEQLDAGEDSIASRDLVTVGQHLELSNFCKNLRGSAGLRASGLLHGASP